MKIRDSDCSVECVYLCGHRVRFGLCARDVASGPQPPEQMEKCRPTRIGSIDRDRVKRVDMGGNTGVIRENQMEVFRQYPNHNCRFLSDPDRSSNNAGIGPETPSPKSVRDDDGAWSVRPFIFGTEEAAQSRLGTEEWQEVRRDNADLDLFCYSFSLRDCRKRSIRDPNSADLIKFFRHLPDLE